jgi:hypothetical protein
MKRIFLFQKNHLPEDGWLQSCIICSEITGNYKHVKKYKLPLNLLCCRKLRNQEIYGYICKNCVKFRKKKFYNSCISSLNSYF